MEVLVDLSKALKHAIGTAEHNMALRKALAPDVGELVVTAIKHINIKGLKKPSPKRCRAYIDLEDLNSVTAFIVILVNTLQDIRTDKERAEYVYKNLYTGGLDDFNAVMYALFRRNSDKSFSMSTVNAAKHTKAASIPRQVMVVTSGAIHCDVGGKVVGTVGDLAKDIVAKDTYPELIGSHEPFTLILAHKSSIIVNTTDYKILVGEEEMPDTWRPPLQLVTHKEVVTASNVVASTDAVVLLNIHKTKSFGLRVKKQAPFELLDVTGLKLDKDGNTFKLFSEYKGDKVVLTVPDEFVGELPTTVSDFNYSIVFDTNKMEAIGVGVRPGDID